MPRKSGCYAVSLSTEISIDNNSAFVVGELIVSRFLVASDVKHVSEG